MRYHPFSHFGLKVVALALAILFWMMVSAQVSSVDRGQRARRQVSDARERSRVGDALLVATLKERATSVDHEACNAQEHGEQEDAEDQGLPVFAARERMKLCAQLSTLAVRLVVR